MNCASKLELHGAGRAVALLADDDFGAAVHLLHLALPGEVLGRAFLGLLVLEVVFLAIDEEHDVGVLLDRAGVAEVGELRMLVVALLDGAAELGEAR